MSASEGLNSNEKDAAFLHKDLKGESQKTTTGIHHLSDWSDSHDLYHGKINGQHHATSVKRFKGNTGPNSLHKTGFQGRSHHDIIKSAVKRDNPHLSSAEAHNVATQIHNSHPTVKEDLDADPQSMDNRRLSAIARNPNHPLHTHAKAELVRRKVKKAEMDEQKVDEVLDTPQARKSYRDKRDASYDRAAKSMRAKILGDKPQPHSDELRTMNKREKGLKMLNKKTGAKPSRWAIEAKDPEEYDNEGSMMKSQLRQICSANEKLMSMVKDDDNLPEWVQSKVTKATDYIRSVRDYLESEKMEEKTLTPAELKKREKIAKAIERDNPDMPMDKKMAIATATAKRVAEGLNEDKRSEIYHSHMSFHHAMKQAEYKKKNPELAKKHYQAGSLHAKVADMHADNHPDASKHGTKADKMSKALDESLRVAESKDDDYHKTLGQTKNSDEGIAALKKKHGMSHTKAVATLKRLMGEQKVNELKKSTLASYIKKASDDRAKNAYDIGKSGKINYKGLKRRQGINRAVNKMANEENIDEVLDTPKAMRSYKDKAKYSKDRAANSAAAKILRGPDADGNRADHSPELKTMAKRDKGLKMADKAAMRKTFKALRTAKNTHGK